ncbi:hypothetical protein SSPO_004760 [Streptomyces antimycoticus]|uniref:Uncharacterized protein n=1 Tax=Streptomyces antimycoticus TaxID=68175 RepID=A0A499UEH4_9ACTN|nr:hypothetical protein SSPO_004760 [Streptomyces antimycoticus]
MWCVAERGAGGVGQAGVDEGLVQHGADGFIGERAVLAADAPLEQQRGGLLPLAFAAVVGADQGTAPVVFRTRQMIVLRTSASPGLTRSSRSVSERTRKTVPGAAS